MFDMLPMGRFGLLSQHLPTYLGTAGAVTAHGHGIFRTPEEHRSPGPVRDSGRPRPGRTAVARPPPRRPPDPDRADGRCARAPAGTRWNTGRSPWPART